MTQGAYVPTPGAAGTAAAPGPPTRRWLVPALAAALVVAVALVATLGAMLASSDDVGGYISVQTPAVERRAREVVEVLTNYDSTTLASQADRMREIATGTFLRQYEDIVGSGLVAALGEASSASHGAIQRGPDVAFSAPDRAIALVQTTQVTQSKENPEGQSFVYEMKITLVATSEGQWKVDGVEILSERSR